MPNWCFTDYRFFADTATGKEQIHNLFSKLKEAISAKKRVIESDFKAGWLGNVLLECVPDKLRLTATTIYCNYNEKNVPFRGSITYLELNANDPDYPYICLQTDTAFEPMNELWDMLLAECGYDKVRYVYSAEETNEGIYINSDAEGRFFTDRYRVEVYISDEFYCCEVQYFQTEQDVLEFLNDVIHDLREEYKRNPGVYALPEGYRTRTLRRQKTVKGALKLLENNLFPAIAHVGYGGYVNYHEFTAE